MKEYNDYLVLGVPTRFFRDWIVSRYLDKILEQVKSFKQSLNRIEFKIIEDNKENQEYIKIDELNKVTEIKDSILNYKNISEISVASGVVIDSNAKHEFNENFIKAKALIDLFK